jgi:hypothetical protein
MRARRKLLAAAVLMGTELLAVPALADDPFAAKTLFDRGVEDLEAGRFETACPAIEESYKLDPRPGTLFTLAECEAKRGRVATALRRYEDYLALYETLSADKRAKQGDREQVARAQKLALGAQVPELILALPPDAPQDTQVTIDGVGVERSELGVRIRVDPGDHVVNARAPGGPFSTARITLQVGEKKGIALVVPVVDKPAPVMMAGPAPTNHRNWRLPVGVTVTGLGAMFLATFVISSVEVNSIQNNAAFLAYRQAQPASSSRCDDAVGKGQFNDPNGTIASLCSQASTFRVLEFVAAPSAAFFGGAGIYFLATGSKPAARSVTFAPRLGPRLTGLDASIQF